MHRRKTLESLAASVVIACILSSGFVLASPSAPLTPLEHGKLLYLLSCSRCHGDDAIGNGPDAAAFETAPVNLREAEILGAHSDDELVKSILADQPKLRPFARMPEKAPQTDALYRFLRQIPSVDWEQADFGRAIYVGRCSPCHGHYGHRDPPPTTAESRSRDLSSPAFQSTVRDADLRALLRHGKPQMPELFPPVTDAEAGSLLRFVRLLSPGHELYSRYCVVCHGPHGKGSEGDPRRRPPFAFDKKYFREHSAGVRERIWHMLRGARPAMPHFESTLTSADVKAILTYLRSLPPVSEQSSDRASPRRR